MNGIPTVDFLANVLVFLEFAWFCSSILRNRNPILSTVLGILFLGIIPTFFTGIINGPLLFAIAILAFWIYLYLSYDGTFREKLLVYFLGYITVTISQALTASAFGIMNMTYEKYSFHLMITSSVLGFALLFLVSRTWKSLSLVMSSGRFMAFFLLPASQFLMTVVFVFCFSKNTGSTGPVDLTADHTLAIAFCAVFILSLIADSLFLDGVVKLAQDIKERERLQTLEMESELTYQYIKNMEGDIREMRKYRHDFLNTLATVQSAVETNDEGSRKDALAMIQQLTNEVSSVTGKRYCECSLVNCILDREEHRMAEHGISCDLRAELPEQLGVSELDLCRVLTNLFDNAAQGCLGLPDTGERCVSSNMRVSEGYLYITVRNSCPDGKLCLETHKEDKALHGLGLNIIRDIAHRSSGELIITEEDGSVSITVTMKWD